jgi:SNF2 family DNA or RNA helicase
MTFRTMMMVHQQMAVDKLSHVKVGALYMDMGTGKTRTALELGIRRMNIGKVDCILWCCPVPVKQTIVDEVTKHVNNAIIEMISTRKIKNWNADIYIAGIESLSSSIGLNCRMIELVSRRRCFLICDESSLIKNHRANRTLSLWRLAERCKYKLLLTGTPITNNEQDLFAQWYFLDPRILGYTSFYSFAANHLEYDPDIPGRVLRAHDVDLLSRKMAPFVYQIKKSECLDLPKKSYSSRCCNMPDNQSIIYADEKDYILSHAMRPDGEWDTTIIYRLFSALQKILSGIDYKGRPIFEPKENPRTMALIDLISELGDNKAIIWCKYTHEITELATILGNRAVCFYGNVSQKGRQNNLKLFSGPVQFLIANENCGAFGLNLQFCQYEIYYDQTFSWEKRSQSEDRIHRAGQTHNVEYIDIFYPDTIDSRIRSCLSNKESLAESFTKCIDKFKDKKDLEEWIDGKDYVRIKRKPKAS